MKSSRTNGSVGSVGDSIAGAAGVDGCRVG